MENENQIKEEIKTDLEKLKDYNAEFEKELFKSREMQAERQKIEAERILSSTAGQPTPEKKLTEEEIKKNTALEFWKGTGIDDAIRKLNG